MGAETPSLFVVIQNMVWSIQFIMFEPIFGLYSTLIFGNNIGLFHKPNKILQWVTFENSGGLFNTFSSIISFIFLLHACYLNHNLLLLLGCYQGGCWWTASFTHRPLNGKWVVMWCGTLASHCFFSSNESALIVTAVH